MFVGGIQIKAQALKFANEMQIEDLRLKFSDGGIRHFKFFEHKRGLLLVYELQNTDFA